MILYLDKFHNEHFSWYKRGHSKWPDPYKRYEGHYLLEHGVKLTNLAVVEFSTKDWIVAKTIAESIEHSMNQTWPCKNDPGMRIEEHLQVPEFDGMLDGSTEFIYLKDGQSEKDIIEHFETSTQDIWKIIDRLRQQSNWRTNESKK